MRLSAPDQRPWHLHSQRNDIKSSSSTFVVHNVVNPSIHWVSPQIRSVDSGSRQPVSKIRMEPLSSKQAACCRDKTLSMVHDVTIDVLTYCNHARDLCNTITHYLPSLQLIESYWWKGMASDVSEYCKRCQRVNNRLGRAKVELHPIPVTDVWKQIGIDLIGKLYMYILGLVFGVIGSFITPAFF